MNSNKELIKIFNNMNFKNKSMLENKSDEENAFVNQSSPDLKEILKNNRGPKPFVNAADAAAKALVQWKKFSALGKSNFLHKIWSALVDKLDKLPHLKNDFSIIVDFFNFNSDVAGQFEKISAEPIGVVLIILPPLPCFFFLGATVSAALAAGCSIIIHTKQAAIPLLLEDIITNVGLPEGIFNVVTEPLTNYSIVSENINKTIYGGSFSAVKDFYFENTFESFNFFCPNNTAAFILESSDVKAAVGQIFHKTWDCASFWAVSTAVVQESILQEFLDTLKFEMEYFLNASGNRLEFKNKEMSEKINNVIFEAVKAGAEVIKTSFKENEWGPTVLLNYQNENNLPILKILVCRTPKEGVKLLNNCCNVLGTSIWSEFSGQALEVASQLLSPNIWINCHGVIDAKVPLSLTGLSGNFILGGRYGILEYLSSGRRDRPESKCNGGKVSQKSQVLEIVLSAKKAFDSWHSNKNKKKCFKALADYLARDKEFSDYAQTFNYLACFTNFPKFLEKNYTEDFSIVYEEVPVGILSLFISCEIDNKELTFLIALSIALGNAVILVMEKENSFVTGLVNSFNKNFPKNLLNVVFGSDAGLYLASDPNIEALWIYSEKVLTIQELRKESSKYLKHLWVVPKDVHLHEELIWKECIRRKIVWLPKVEKFP